eukprot:CAMPEP_0206442306 /NCGR_PEP_ID=MMETSP0324_2-20121206/13751_1 /ASSEMBLY_ACC=CAM_ASM_000836 /TAXON_ID=2866 /ORGANISM="Crypthecodinium cohnii, Strain Seligo" /LENGTH=292 /DNA_ID=CAMNT_0053910139 /DNA_START=252 /DNA_END=1131 /DNA_ORIENTATION=-
MPSPPPLHQSLKLRSKDLEQKLSARHEILKEVTSSLKSHREDAAVEMEGLRSMAEKARREQDLERLMEQKHAQHSPKFSGGSTRGPSSLAATQSSLCAGLSPSIISPDPLDDEELVPDLGLSMESIRWKPRPRLPDMERTGPLTERGASARRQESLFGASSPLSSQSCREALLSSTHSDMMPASSRLTVGGGCSGSVEFQLPANVWTRRHPVERSHNWVGLLAGEAWEPTSRPPQRGPIGPGIQGPAALDRSLKLSQPASALAKQLRVEAVRAAPLPIGTPLPPRGAAALPR